MKAFTKTWTQDIFSSRQPEHTATIAYHIFGEWRKWATYSKAVALEVVRDSGFTSRNLKWCVVDDATGEVLAAN